jgi:tetratricopeptide (TPR) repeat protein
LLDLAAKTHLALGELDAAERASRRALTRTPKNPARLARLGHILARQNKNEEAVSILEKVKAITPDNPLLLQRLVSVRLKLKQVDQAEQEARHLVSVAPRDPQAHMLLASVLKEKGHREDALACAKRAAEIDPSNEKFKQFVATLETPPRQAKKPKIRKPWEIG